MLNRHVAALGLGLTLIAGFLLFVWENPPDLLLQAAVVVGVLLVMYGVLPLIFAGSRAVFRAVFRRQPGRSRPQVVIGEISWDHYSAPHVDGDDLHHIQMNVALSSRRGWGTVTMFRLDIEGKAPVHAAEFVHDQQGKGFLRSAVGGSTSIAGQHASWHRPPVRVEAGEPEAGWLGFIIPHEHALTYGYCRSHTLQLVTVTESGEEVATTFEPPPAP